MIGNILLSLQNKWIGLLHHVCNDDEWTGGQCDHGEMTEDGGHPPWFDRRDKDFVTLQKIILEPILLESFKYYVKFRYVQLVIKCIIGKNSYALRSNPFSGR